MIATQSPPRIPARPSLSGCHAEQFTRLRLLFRESISKTKFVTTPLSTCRRRFDANQPAGNAHEIHCAVARFAALSVRLGEKERRSRLGATPRFVPADAPVSLLAIAKAPDSAEPFVSASVLKTLFSSAVNRTTPGPPLCIRSCAIARNSSAPTLG
jgi:hypothetical protein